MSFWKRLKEAAFGASQESSSLVGGDLDAGRNKAPPAAPLPTTTEQHNHAIANDDLILSDNGTDSVTSSKASVIDITPGARKNPVSLVDYSDSELSDADSDKITPTTRRIPPPPELNIYDLRINHTSEQKATDALDEWAQQEGFAIKKSNRYTNKEGYATRVILCVRGGPIHYTKVADEKRTRRSSTIIAQEPCRFRVQLKEEGPYRRWHRYVITGEHTHGPAESAPGVKPFAQHRRRQREANPQITQHITADWESQIEPKKTWSTLQRLFPNTAITLQDVRNQRRRYASTLDGGRPAVQALIHSISGHFAYHYVVDEEYRLVHLALFHYEAVEVLKRWPFALAMDTTYKTNKHGLYLFQIIATTALNTCFIVGQAFLSSEDTEAYSFALEWLRQIYVHYNLGTPTTITIDKCDALIAALQLVFPQVPRLICIWHINKNVEVYARKLFKAKLIENEGSQVDRSRIASVVGRQWDKFRQDWYKVLYATSVNDFEIAWSKLHERWSESNTEMLKYLSNEWISDKEHCITAWTQEYRHFGNATTSKAEAMHKAIKAELPKTHHVHLREAVRRFQAFILRNNRGLEQQLCQDRIRIEWGLRSDDCFTGLHEYISSWAMTKVREHVSHLYAQPGSTIKPCKGLFTKVWGLPCGHDYFKAREEQRALRLDQFHAQWRLDRLSTVEELDTEWLLRDPIKIRSKRAKEAENSKTRQLSLFELMRLQIPDPSPQDLLNNAQIESAVAIIPRHLHPVVTALEPLSSSTNGTLSIAASTSVDGARIGKTSEASALPNISSASSETDVTASLHQDVAQPQHNAPPPDTIQNRSELVDEDTLLSTSQIPISLTQELLCGTDDWSVWLDGGWSMFGNPSQQSQGPISPHRNGFVAVNLTTPVSTGQALSNEPIADLFGQEIVLPPPVVGGHLPVYSATSPRRSQRGLKRREPPEDEVWYKF
jgi:hypothetical protein